MITTLLFDYGGTLDTAACHWAYVLQSGYTHAHLELADQDFRDAYVYAERALAKSPVIQPTDTFKQLLLKKVSLEFQYLEEHHICTFKSAAARQEKVEAVASWCDDFARSHVQAAGQVLESLQHKGYHMVMVSNFYGNLHTILEDYGIARYFTSVVESAVVGVRKPDPTIWTLGIKAAGCKPEEAAAIGDSYGKDILPAREAGCGCTIWYKGREWEEKQRDESLPTHLITDLNQLLEIL